jgi:ABC-type transport system involved in multi-copper enzyme maturation permease subunit
MTLQPEDFWSFSQWLLRPGAFLESALMQGVAVTVLLALLGLLFGYLVSAVRYGPVEGFYAVARVVREFVTHDLPQTRIRRIVAMARLAIKEAIRRKVLVVIGLFIVALMFAGWFLDPTSSDPGRLYVSFVLTVTNFLLIVLALLVSTFSIPQDIKSRTIYTIVTKPVNALEIVLGRILGFTAVGTMLLVPMGLASYLFIARGLQHSHEVEEADVRGGQIRGRTNSMLGHSHEFQLDTDKEGLTDSQRGHRHLVTQEADGSLTVGPVVGLLRGRQPLYGSLEFLDRFGKPADQGINVGYEDIGGGYGAGGLARLLGRVNRRDVYQHGYVEGGALTAAIYTFSGLDSATFAEGLPLDLSLRAFRTVKGDIVTGVRGTLSVRNPETGAESQPITFIVREYELDQQFIPNQLRGTVNDQVKELGLFEDLVTTDGRTQVLVRCVDDGQYLGMTQSDLYIRAGDSSFAWNLAKAYIDIWLQMVIVISFGVMFSTFLSGPVALVATCVAVLLGMAAEWVFELSASMATGSRRNLGGGPIESLIRLLRQDAMTTEFDLGTIPRVIIQGIDRVAVYMLDAVATALPNLPKMNTSEFVAGGMNIFGVLVGRHATAAVCYLVLAVLVGYFFLKTREVAG